MALILIIEDEKFIRTNLIKIIKFNGFEAIGAEDGETGIEMAKQYSPDLIVCDIMMPGIDGYGVLETLAQDLETASIPFIFLSAKSDRSDMRQGMELGADDYLTKPFNNTELIQAIRSRLKKQETLRQPMVSAIKQAVMQLNELAYHDPLTKLPNRIMLYQKLQELLMQLKYETQTLAVLCIQMQRYRNINVVFGQSNSDLLLQAIAQRLTQWAKSDDLVARINEAEFSLVLILDPQKQDITQLVQELLNHLAFPYKIEDQDIRVQFKIGITVYPQDCNGPDQLLNHASLAMRWQPQQETNSYQFYSTEMTTRFVEQKVLETSLHQALERSELELHYQPQVNLVTGRVIGAEALLRWRHPTLGLISPATFIPIAEETGLIIPIGEWVLQTACAEAQSWQRIHQFPVRIAVNLSTLQVKQPTFLDAVTSILKTTQIAPELVELEITETGMMDDIDAITAALRQLKALGTQIAIDDFGMGYSSLAYLKKFPIDTLKIDRLFINDMMIDSGNASIVVAIIAMAHSLKLKVIAEGVETQAQLNFLRQQGCHSMQGFLFSRPIPTQEFREMLTTDLRLEARA